MKRYVTALLVATTIAVSTPVGVKAQTLREEAFDYGWQTTPFDDAAYLAGYLCGYANRVWIYGIEYPAEDCADFIMYLLWWSDHRPL